ncbi:TOL [Colletotrichum higginsianum]|nr:TOL [Colletotrichum higginsianum]
MGLAKRHSFATQERPKPTTTNSATILYEAPEAKTSLGKKARSRQYDIWSMGCIITEWMIWILYGNTELKRFYNHIMGPNPEPHKWVPYYEITPTDEGPDLAAAAAPRERSQALLSPGQIHQNNKQATTSVSLQVPPTPSARLENWEFPVDNGFAKNVALRLGEASLNFHHSAPTFLCDRCAKLRFWDPGFYFEDSYDRLQQKSYSCQLCEMLWHACSNLPGAGRPRAAVRFERVESIIKLIGIQTLPVLSILRNFKSSYLVSNFQIGFPQLPKAGTGLFFNILEYWLQDCDNHQGCRVTGEARLPTRLIDVGTQQLPILRLVETGEGISGDSRYIALSHRWGDTRKHRPFCTRLKDENGHDIESFRKAIPYKDVPQTFRDAIETTRRLGIRYLWIDSLCIIQGDGGDFNTEAKRMEDVFSCAYCVIAASRASNPHDGFLGDRPQRQFIAMPQEESSSVFLCEAIDDFGRHVLDGALNQRGWVLQERALARRTIYFTEAQAYFECGKGVRCETLAKMQNSMAEFLGDARFPEKAMKENSRAIKIRYFQDLYRRYSQLEFSHIQDRPIAIAGLENRLRKAYWSTGAYGIFDDRPGHGLFHRSLLWQRSEDEGALKLIDFSFKPESAAPTWSWMAHEGGIDYLDPPFQQMEWEETEIEPPWTVAGSGESHNTHNLRVVARPFNVAGHMPGDVKFVYDNPGRERGSGEHRAMCVVVAKERGDKPVSEKRHYVLVVTGSGAVSGDDKRTLFIRQGVGYMTGKFIGLESEHGLEAIVR